MSIEAKQLNRRVVSRWRERRAVRGRPHRLDPKMLVAHQGNFTSVILTADGRPCSLGLAKRNPIDPFDQEVGEEIALWRALDNMRGVGREE